MVFFTMILFCIRFYLLLFITFQHAYAYILNYSLNLLWQYKTYFSDEFVVFTYQILYFGFEAFYWMFEYIFFFPCAFRICTNTLGVINPEYFIIFNLLYIMYICICIKKYLCFYMFVCLLTLIFLEILLLETVNIWRIIDKTSGIFCVMDCESKQICFRKFKINFINFLFVFLYSLLKESKSQLELPISTYNLINISEQD